MRHRCEACDQLVSFAGHNCPSVQFIIALKRGAIKLGQQVDAAAEALGIAARNLNKWDTTKLKEMVDSIPPPSFVREMLGACPECGAAQFNDNMVAHALGCSRGGPLKHGHAALDNIADDVELSDTMRELIEDIDPLNSDAVRSAESAYAEMCIEREREAADESE